MLIACSSRSTAIILPPPAQTLDLYHCNHCLFKGITIKSKSSAKKCSAIVIYYHQIYKTTRHRDGQTRTINPSIIIKPVRDRLECNLDLIRSSVALLYIVHSSTKCAQKPSGSKLFFSFPHHHFRVCTQQTAADGIEIRLVKRQQQRRAQKSESSNRLPKPFSVNGLPEIVLSLTVGSKATDWELAIIGFGQSLPQNLPSGKG